MMGREREIQKSITDAGTALRVAGRNRDPVSKVRENSRSVRLGKNQE